MSASNSPYSAFAALLVGSGQSVSPAELHGLLLGRCCAGAGFEPAAWLADAEEMVGSLPPDNLRQALIGLQALVREELSGAAISVALLLPGDDERLSDRAAALGQWCQGFLSGFGMTVGDRPLSTDTVDLLQDFASIAQVQSSLAESEAGERDYMQVVEYLRVVPPLLFSECAQPMPAQPRPAVH